MVADNYVRIMVIYHPFVDNGISVSKIQHSMLDLLSNKMFYYKRNTNNILPTSMLAYLLINKN